MKKWIIGALVGGLLIFAWQGASWMALNLHEGATKYHPAQDSIMSYLSTQFSEEGAYMLPTVKAGATTAERDECMKKAMGHPWAMIVYHPKMEDDMMKSLIRGFLIECFVVFCFLYIISRGGGWPTPTRVFAASVAMGLLLFLFGPYTNHNFMSLPWSAIKADLIDYLVSWTLCGAWLAWWLGRKASS